MPLPDSPFRVATDDAVATLWLGPATLTPAAVGHLADLAEAVAARPAVEVLVVRTAYSGGFPTFDLPTLRDLRTDADAASYARAGQQALRRIAELQVPTVAFLEGPCVGPGLELALACDHRLAVATPDAVLDFGDLPTTWGGRARLAKRIGRRTASRFVACSPREAARSGLVDDAFCQRRAKIELRSFLAGLPTKRGVPTDLVAEAEERVRFRAAVRDGLAIPADGPAFEPMNPVPERPRRVGVLGDGATVAEWVGEFALREVPVTWLPTTGSAVCPLREAVARGRVTPLEAEQAARRVAVVTEPDEALTADLVVIDHTDESGAALLERVMPARSVLLLPADELADVLPTCARPGRVLGWEMTAIGVRLVLHPEATDDAAVAALRWLAVTGRVAAARAGRDTSANRSSVLALAAY